MSYEWKEDKRGNRRFSRVVAKPVAALPKSKPAKAAVVVEPVVVEEVAEPVEAAVSVPTTPKPKKKSDG